MLWLYIIVMKARGSEFRHGLNLLYEERFPIDTALKIHI